MKNRKSLFTVAVALLAVAAVIGLWPSPTARADSQGLPSTMGTATNLPAVVNTNTASNQVSVVSLRMNRGLALQWKIATPGVATGTLWVYPSVDGTNLASLPLATLSGTTTASVTNLVIVQQWARTALEGYQAVALSTMSNSGAGVLTNQGVIWQFPNN